MSKLEEKLLELSYAEVLVLRYIRQFNIATPDDVANISENTHWVLPQLKVKGLISSSVAAPDNFELTTLGSRAAVLFEQIERTINGTT